MNHRTIFRQQCSRFLPANLSLPSRRRVRSVRLDVPSRFSSRQFSSLVSWDVEESSEKKTIGIVTLRSPETYNSLSEEMADEFRDLMFQLEDELSDTEGNSISKNVGAIVLRGEGDKAFSAGGNLKFLQSKKENSVHANVDGMLRFYKSFLCVREKIPVPVIGALHGPAVGAGACLALACDMRVVASGDRPILGFPFSKLGIPTGMGALHLLQNSSKLSNTQAGEILFLGKTLTGEEALDCGLANRLVPKERVKEEAKQLALEIARTGHPVAIRSMVRSMRLATDHGSGSLADCMYRDAHAQAMCYNREDWGEGLRAAKTKRDPSFDDYHSK